MAETLALDATSEAAARGRVEFDITDLVGEDGPDWGQAEVDAYMAEAASGQVPVDFRVPNRIVTVPLLLRRVPGMTYDEARTAVQAKVALFQHEGGWLSRTTAIGVVHADVVNATLKMGGSSFQARDDGVDPDALLTLECLPDWYGDEIALDTISETSALALAGVLEESAADAVIRGDFPARTRIVVTDADSESRLGLIWGVRSRYYDSASTAQLLYEAEALTPLDSAAIATVSGASGGGSNNAVRHASLGIGWTPVLSTQILSGSAHMTHRGDYRVRARVHTTSATPPRLRLIWGVGDALVPVENTPVVIPGAGNWFLVDLGVIRLQAPPVGSHRWIGAVQARGAAGGENVSIDAIELQPVGETSGWFTASPFSPDPALSTYVARDEFQQSSGNLAGKTLPVGGTWAGAGDADDFTIETTGDTARRTVSDTIGIQNGRFGLAGTGTYAAIAVGADIKWSQPVTGGLGVFARYADTSNFLLARISTNGPPLASSLVVEKRVAGTTTVLVTVDVGQLGRDAWTRLLLIVDASGRLRAWHGNQQSLRLIATAQDADLASGGALDDGRVGIWDQNASGSSSTRDFDNFAAWAPASEAVVFADQSIEIRTDGCWREDSGGVSSGPIVGVGALPRLPVGGLENREVELYVRGSRGDFDQLPDAGIDDISAQVSYHPCWLYVPDGP
jgi:hypothetical protein